MDEYYNFVLVNFYVDGIYFILFYFDDEFFFGINFCIVFFSLGGMWDFVMKYKMRKDVNLEKFVFWSGDMVVM